MFSVPQIWLILPFSANLIGIALNEFEVKRFNI